MVSCKTQRSPEKGSEAGSAGGGTTPVQGADECRKGWASDFTRNQQPWQPAPAWGSPTVSTLSHRGDM